MKIEGYEVEEVEPGVRIYTRKNASHTTFDQAHPWIHFHYGKSDEQAERDRETEVELCCHGCGVSLWISMTFPTDETINVKGTVLRAEFTKNHAAHGDSIYIEGDDGIVTELTRRMRQHPLTFLCPDFRKQTFMVSLG